MPAYQKGRVQPGTGDVVYVDGVALGIETVPDATTAVHTPEPVTGATGPKGTSGDEGPPGPTGPQGDPGVQGIQGIAGMQGLQGVAGPQGIQGNIGHTGPSGNAGSSGPTGPQGTPGVAGVGLTNRGKWISGQTYSPNDYVFDTGSVATSSMWIMKAPAAIVSTKQPKTDLTNWVEFAAPSGATGPQGPVGLSGASGPQGLQGVQGPQGTQGLQGAQGVQGPGGATGPTGPAGAAMGDVATKSYVDNLKGIPDGLASLDASAHLKGSQIPPGLIGTLNARGGWNAKTNVPPIGNGGAGGANGDVLIVAVAGDTLVDGNATWIVPDMVLNNGSNWQRIPVSSGFGDMSAQNANSVAITGGSVTGLNKFGYINGEYTYIDPLTPDYAHTIVDSTGKIAISIGVDGTLYAARAVLTSASIIQADMPSQNFGTMAQQNANAVAITGGTITGISTVDLINADRFLPDNTPDAFAHSIADPQGNIAFGVGRDGTVYVANAVLNSAIIGGTSLSSFGTMASQNADAVTITGGSSTGLTQIGLVNKDHIVPQTTAVDGTLFALTVEDDSGNISFAVGNDGVLHAASITLSQASIDNLSLTSITTTSATVGGDLIAPMSQQPDLAAMTTDESGNIVTGLSRDGILHVYGLDAVNSITVGGKPIGGSSGGGGGVGNDAVDVRQYGALGDAKDNYGYVTTNGSTLTLYNFSGTLSVSQVDSNTALLTITGDYHTGWAFRQSHIGSLVYIVAGDYALLGTVTKLLDGTNIWLDALSGTPNITPLTNVIGTVTCPAFDSSMANKSLVIEGMGQDTWWRDGLTHLPDTVTPYGMYAWIGSIGKVSAPNAITGATVFPFNWTAFPTHLMWGTNDADACAQAAWAAFNANKRKIYFSGNNALYLLLGIVLSGPTRNNYLAGIGTDYGPLINGVMWYGDNARTYTCTGGALNYWNHVTLPGAATGRDCVKTIYGRMSFPRCAQLSTINVLITGDSLGVFSPQEQAGIVSHATEFMQQFVAQNPGKRVNFYNISIGGQTYSSLWNPNAIITTNSNPAQYWVVPKPFAGPTQYIKFYTNINQTGVGPAIVPDLVVIMDNGGNDTYCMDGLAMHALINLIRHVPHSDNFGPTDICLQTDLLNVIQSRSSGPGGGVLIPDALTRPWFHEWAAGLIRTTARSLNYGCYDLLPMICRACYGFDPTRRALRQVPSATLNVSPSTPASLAYQCRDFSGWLRFPADNDAAAWAQMKQLDIQISLNPGNRVMLRLGTNGNLWLGQSAFGYTVPTVCTVNAGSNVITLGPSTDYQVIYNNKETWPQVWLTNNTGIFASSMVGKCMIAPTGDQTGPTFLMQRNYIRQVMDTNNALMFERVFNNASILNQSMTLSIGGQRFIPMDGNSMTDIVIFYPNGTIFNTQVAYNGYTSASQATMVDSAPQSLNGQTVPIFLGRMGIKWFDTGITPNIASNTGTYEININRGYLMLGYHPSFPLVPMTIDRPIEKFGAEFNPVFYVQGTQQIICSNWWVDDTMPFAASCTPWEIRGFGDTYWTYEQGGVGGHDGSRMRSEVLDPFFAIQNLSTG